MGKKISIFLTFLAVIFTFMLNGCGGGYGNEGANSVGSVLKKATLVDDIDNSVMLSIIKTKVDPSATDAFGYKAIKIVYRTKDINGKDIDASGLLVIPIATDAYKSYLASKGKSFSVSLVCDNHGTIFLNSEAPSVVEKTNGMPDSTLTTVMTGYAGFAVAMPDYVGYGDSKGAVHPYILKSSAQASLDMIRASIKYMTDNKILFNGQLFISGYSEGGYVSMALAEEIEQKYSNEFQLKGVAPMAGPYDIESLGVYDLNASMKMVYPALLAEVAYSYSKAYSDINISDLVVKPEVFENVPLFGGDYDAVPIHLALGLADLNASDYGIGTHYTNELFKDSFINDYQANVNNPVRVLFAENSVYKWKPKTKVMLIQCTQDEIIPFAMSQIAYNYFTNNGTENTSNITLYPITDINQSNKTTFVHVDCATKAYYTAISWFDKIRKGEIK